MHTCIVFYYQNNKHELAWCIRQGAKFEINVYGWYYGVDKNIKVHWLVYLPKTDVPPAYERLLTIIMEPAMGTFFVAYDHRPMSNEKGAETTESIKGYQTSNQSFAQNCCRRIKII